MTPEGIKAGWTEREPDQTAEKNLYWYEQYGVKQTVTILNYTDAEQKSSNGINKKWLGKHKAHTQQTLKLKQQHTNNTKGHKSKVTVQILSWGE